MTKSCGNILKRSVFTILGLSFALDDGEKSIADTKNTMMTLPAVVALVASLI